MLISRRFTNFNNISFIKIFLALETPITVVTKKLYFLNASKCDFANTQIVAKSVLTAVLGWGGMVHHPLHF